MLAPFRLPCRKKTGLYSFSDCFYTHNQCASYHNLSSSTSHLSVSNIMIYISCRSFYNALYMFLMLLLFTSPPTSADRCQGGYDAIANIRAEVFFFRGMAVISRKNEFILTPSKMLKYKQPITVFHTTLFFIFIHPHYQVNTFGGCINQGH